MSTRFMVLFFAAALASVPALSAQDAPTTPRRGVGMALAGDDEGVSVAQVFAGSPAEKAGLKVGDKLVSVAGIAIFDLQQEQMRALADTAKTIAIVVMRGDQKLTFTVEPAVTNMPALPPSEGGAPR